MTSYLNALIDKKITELHLIHEVTEIYFDRKTKLSIFNEHKFTPRNPTQIIGCTVNSISETSDAIKFLFDKGGELEIYLDNSSWTGPEALEIVLPDGQIVVWN